MFLGSPGLGQDEEPSDIEMLISLSQLWKLHLLESICINIQNGDAHLNPSVAVYHNTEMGERLAKDFLCAKKWTDLVIDVEGNLQDCVYYKNVNSTYNITSQELWRP